MSPVLTVPIWHRIALQTTLCAYALCVVLAGLAYWGAARAPALAYNVSGLAFLAAAAIVLTGLGYAATLIVRPATRVWILSRANATQLLGVTGAGFVAIALLGPLNKLISAEYRMAFRVLPDELRIEGAVAPSLPDRLRALPADYRPARVVLANNDGGAVRGILDAVPYIREHGWKIVVIEGACASSCAYLAMLFEQRFMAPDARLGFHDIRQIDDKRVPDSPDRRRLTDSLVGMGYSAELVQQLLSSDELVWFDRQEALSRHLINGCWSTQAVAPVSCADPDRLSMSSTPGE